MRQILLLKEIEAQRSQITCSGSCSAGICTQICTRPPFTKSYAGGSINRWVGWQDACRAAVGLPSPDLSDLLPNRPPWRSAPHVLNLSWTGSCGLWGRPITLAASLVWCAIVASMASLSRWMPPARSTALRTSTGQAGSPTFDSGCLAFPVFLISSSCPSTSLSCFSPLPCLVLVNITLSPNPRP